MHTKSPVNRINTLIIRDLSDATLRASQELQKNFSLSPASAWHMQLAKASKIHLDQ